MYPRLRFQGLPRAGKFLGLLRQLECLRDESLRRQFALRNVRSDGNIFQWFSVRAGERNHGCGNPVRRTIFGPVFDFTVPNLSGGDTTIHLLEKLPGMMAGV